MRGIFTRVSPGLASRSLVLLVLAAHAGFAETTADTRAQWAETLKYGIDSQIVELVQRIRDAKDTNFGPDLAAVLSKSKSTDVQKAILDLLTDQGLRDAEETAKGFLATWRDRRSDVALSTLRYLAEMKTQGISEYLLEICDGEDNALALQAIDALGKIGDAGVSKSLLERLESQDFQADRKPQLVLAIGNQRDPAAVDALIAIVKNRDAESALRLYAAASLGRIGDQKAIPVLKDLLKESDALSRAYAAGALVNFDVSLVIDELFQGLRDDNWKVRVECAKALARQLPANRISDAVSILLYKAKWDPVSQVKLEAIRSLAAIGNEAAMAGLLRIFGDLQASVETREKSLSLLTEKGISSQVLDDIKRTIDADWNAKNSKALQAEAKVLSMAKSEGLEPIFAKFLGSQDLTLRIYGIRGIELNRFSGQKERLLELAVKDPYPYVQAEAKRVSSGL